MDPFSVSIILAIGLLVALLFIFFQQLQIKKMGSYFKAERDTKMSLAVKHGMTMEHLVPWTTQFDGDPRQFRFIGDPIDGVLFGNEKVTFVEFKTGNSKLSEKQRIIKNLVNEKKIEWKEIRI